MHISLNISSFDAFTRAPDDDVVGPSSLVPTAAAAVGHSSLLIGVCVVSVLLFVALMVILKQNLGPVNELLAHVNGLIDRIRGCFGGAGNAADGQIEMAQMPAGNELAADVAGRNLSDSDRAARLRGLVRCV